MFMKFNTLSTFSFLWKSTILALIGLCSTLSINAQTPEKYNYQAVARDASGNLMSNTQVGLRITIRQANTTGPIVYQETHLLTTNQFGLFNLQVGGGTVVSGAFNSISWGDNAYYQQVELDPNGTTGGLSYTNMGTNQLVSVPYALYAKEAGAVTGGGSGQWLLNGNNISNTNSGTVSVGTATPAQQSSLYVTGPTEAIWADAEGGYTAIVGSGTNGSVGVSGSSDTGIGVDAGSGTGSGLNAYSSSGTGVNTVTNGGIGLHSNNFMSGNETWLSTNNAAIYSKGRLDFGNSNLSSTSHFYYGPNQDIYLRSGTPGSFITLNDTHNGNIYLANGGGIVGINNGTYPASGTLTVRGNGSASSTAEFYPVLGDYNAAFNAPSAFNFRLNDGTGHYYSTFIRGGQIGSRVYLNDVHNGDVIAATGGGKVGIGTNYPDTKLHVDGQTTFFFSGGGNNYDQAPVIIRKPNNTSPPHLTFVGSDDSPNFSCLTLDHTSHGLRLQYNSVGYAYLYVGSVFEFSDINNKKLIDPITENHYSQYLQQIRNIESINYLFKGENLTDKEPNPTKRERQYKHVGFAAQSLPKALIQSIPKNPNKPEEGSDILFSSSGMLGLLTVGVKALDNEQTQLKATVERQNAIIEQQNATIEQLNNEIQIIKQKLNIK